MIDPEGKDGGASRSNLRPMLLGAILGSGLTAGAFALASHRTLGSALRADRAPPNEKWSLGSVLGMAAETSQDFFTDPNFDFGETGEKWSDAMKPAASAVEAARGMIFGGKPDPPEVPQVIFVHDAVLDDLLGETLVMDAHAKGDINLLGSIVVNADSVPPTSFELVKQFRSAYYGSDAPTGNAVTLTEARLFNPFPIDYRRDSWKMHNLPVMQSIPPAEFLPSCIGSGDAWLEETLEAAADNSITLLQVATLTNLKTVFEKKPYLAKKVTKMVWMAGAIDVAGNLEERHWAGFPKMTKAMFDKWGCKTVGEPAPCQDPDSEYGRGFPEWNVWGDVPAVDYIFRTTDFPIYLAPLDLADQLPIPGEFMKTLDKAYTPKCNKMIYNALNVSYSTFAAPQPFYRLWDSSAVMYGLKPELFGEVETTELAVGTTWEYQGLLIRKSEAEMGMPPVEDFVDACVREGVHSPVAFREVNIVLGLAEPGNPQPIFDFAAESACAAESNKGLSAPTRG